jgi:hypothetical protein
MRMEKHKNVRTEGQTDRHDEVSSRFWRFCVGALKRVINAKHRIYLPTVYMQHTEIIKSKH